MRSGWFILLFAVTVSASLDVAPAQLATTRPTAVPATRPSIEQLHAQAYQLMRAGQYQKAAAPLEQAYRAKPAAEQGRALLLNHALLDVMQKINAMRAVKDLRDYLRMHPNEPDEQATNFLGAALQIAGKNPRLAQNDLYLAAVKQLQESVEALEKSRPRERKWGPKWYADADFMHIRFKLDETTGRWRFEQEQADRLKTEWQAAQADAQRYNVINTIPQHTHANIADSYSCPICQANRERQRRADEAASNAVATEGRFKAQQQIADRAKAEIPRPDWVTDLTPIDPSAPPPAPIAAPVPAAPASDAPPATRPF